MTDSQTGRSPVQADVEVRAEIKQNVTEVSALRRTRDTLMFKIKPMSQRIELMKLYLEKMGFNKKDRFCRRQKEDVSLKFSQIAFMSHIYDTDENRFNDMKETASETVLQRSAWTQMMSLLFSALIGSKRSRVTPNNEIMMS